MPRYADTSAYSAEEMEVWDKLKEYQGKSFQTATGLPFTYTIKGNEIFFSRKKKSITRATINRAYKKMREEDITREKHLGIFGGSYLFPVFKAIGL